MSKVISTIHAWVEGLSRGVQRRSDTTKLLFVIIGCIGAGVVGVAVVMGVVGIAWVFFPDWVVPPHSPLLALGTVCSDGQGVPEAHGLEGPGPFHVAVLGDHGEEIDWTGKRAEWRADSVSDTALVACVSLSLPLIDTCHYDSETTRSEIQRYRGVASVRVLEARSARLVVEFKINAEEPKECPPKTFSEAGGIEVRKKQVTFEQLSTRLWAEVALQPN